MKQKNNLLTHPFIIALIALFCCALWGSATPFIKIGYSLILPHSGVPSTILFAGIRFTLAGIFTVLIYSIARRKFLFPKPKNITKVATISCFQTIIQYIFFYIGLANTSGVKGTIASGSSAFFTVLIACLVFRLEKISFKKVFACIIGFTGIILINIKGLDFTMNFTGDCFVIFSAISYAISSVLVKIYSKHEDPVIISGYQFILGGIVMCIVGLLMGGWVMFPNVTAIAVLIYLSLLSACAYSLWGVLLKYNPVSKVAIFSFTTPVFGVLLSNLMLSEQSNVEPVNLIITLVLICTGIILLNYQKTK
ncbi:MAG: DMT family transporter [Clostridia bacterium]|nr:DMT family transporter [Clostridia bacterium]